MSSKSVLITAFEPFGIWPTNSSRLCLEQLLPQLPAGVEVVTRIYPVDFDAVPALLESDLRQDFDFALHLGQAQQCGRMRLEAIAINVGAQPGLPDDVTRRLSATGPVAFESTLPLPAWAARLREAGIPAYVSFHAGTYLCNATYYWSHLVSQQLGLRTRPVFIHVPLEVSQTVDFPGDWPTLSAAQSAAAVRMILDEMWRETATMLA